MLIVRFIKELRIRFKVWLWFRKYMPHGMTIIVVPKESVIEVEEFEEQEVTE